MWIDFCWSKRPLYMKKIDKQFENVMFFVALVLEKAMVGWQLRLVFQRCFTILGEYSQVEISFIIGVYPWIIKHVYLASYQWVAIGWETWGYKIENWPEPLNREGALWKYQGLKISLKLQKKIGGWQLKYCLCSPRTLGTWSNLTSIFFRWVETTNQKTGPLIL